MLFLQAAIAFAACEMPGGAGLAGMHAAHGEAMPDCHDPADDPPSLCVAHCQNQEQALGKLQPQMPDLAAPRTVVMAARPPRSLYVPVAAFVPLAAPPPRILFQSFLL